FQRLPSARLQRLTCPRQRGFAAGHQARCPGQLYGAIGEGADPARPAFLLPFGGRPWLPRPPFPPGRPPYGRPAAPVSGADPDRFSVFRTREMRLGRGALFIPGAAVPARPVAVPGRRLPHLSGQPPSPWTATRPGDVMITRHQQGFTVVHPLPAFPWPVTPDGTGPSGFSLSFTPG